MAQDTLNKAIELGKLPASKCKTKNLLIHGADGSTDTSQQLYSYGSDTKGIRQLIDESPELGEKIHPRLEFIKAEVVWAIRNEMARTVEDVLARRIRTLFLDARAAIRMAPEVARLLAVELDKDEKWIDTQLKLFYQLAQGFLLLPNDKSFRPTITNEFQTIHPFN